MYGYIVAGAAKDSVLAASTEIYADSAGAESSEARDGF